MSSTETLSPEKVAGLRAVAAQHREAAERFAAYHRTETSWERPSTWDVRAAHEARIADDLAALLDEVERLRGERDYHKAEHENARRYWVIETGHAEQAEARAEALAEVLKPIVSEFAQSHPLIVAASRALHGDQADD